MSHGKFFLVLFLSKNLYVLAFRKCNKDCDILKIILVQGFCPVQVKVALFSFGFCLQIIYVVGFQKVLGNSFNSGIFYK